jgi:radical SAM superfamily enzyme YgiQ (UPF0313 family)
MPGHHPLLRSPKAIAEMVCNLAQMTRAPIFFVGDLLDGGEGYAEAVLDELARGPVSNRIVFEFFRPPPREFIERIDRSVRCWGAELSPESHDEAVRARLGKATFTNAAMESAIETMLSLRCEQLDLFYMIGLPGQTVQSVAGTVSDIERLFERFDRRLSAFVTPMGPFIDPGSDGFEDAARHGYVLHARTLAEHRQLLEQRDWESMLNYETRWMTRAQIVDSTYDAAGRLNDLKERHGRITPAVAAGVRGRLHTARAIRADLSRTAAIRAFSEGTINDKAELFPPGAFLRSFRVTGILRLLAREVLAAFRNRGVTPPRDFAHDRRVSAEAVSLRPRA